MPDTPDYHKYLPNSIRLSLQDMGELAARLGSIVTYDRRGEVVWFDNFSHGISKYTILLSGTDSSAVLGVVRTGRSGYNMKQVIGTTGNKYVQCYTNVTLLELSKIGMEIAAYFTINPSHFIMGIYHFDGSKRHTYFVKIDTQNKKLYVQNSAGTYIEVSTIPRIDNPDGTIHNFKIIIDTDNQVYVRMQINSLSYDLTVYSHKEDNDSSAPGIMVYFATFGTGGPSEVGTINHVILTSNEP